MYSRLIKPPVDKSFFLFGPRGTGKSSWVKSAFEGALYFDLLKAQWFTELHAVPDRLDKLIPSAHKGWVILDEIQRIPDLLNEVHRLIEGRRIKFILTGSSARKLRKGGVNLLAGRARTFSMYPLTSVELGLDFNLKKSLQNGHLPEAYTGTDCDDFLKSYISTYLREEVQQEGLVRNLGNFSRFLEAASFSQGSVLNISKVAEDCSVERKVVEDYFSILEDLLIAYRLPVFKKRAKRDLVKHMKFYFFDAGVYRSIRPTGPLDAPSEIGGMSFETLVLQELRALNDYFKWNYDIFFWRTSRQMEVDFVLYGDRGLKAIEVKTGPKVRADDLKGLRLFKNDYPMADCYLIYGGHDQYMESEIHILPADEFFRSSREIL